MNKNKQPSAEESEKNTVNKTSASVRKDKRGRGMFAVFLFAFFSVVLSTGMGSVFISPKEIIFILGDSLFNTGLPPGIDPNLESVLMSIRIPRALSSFLVGGMLSVSGCVMQAVLQNPLASSYTLGVSSGASLGAAIAVVSGLSGTLFGGFLLPTFGFAGALITILGVMALCSALDKNVSGTTVVLLGMVNSLFANAIITVISSLNTEHTNRIYMWQLGSFSGRRWYHVSVLFVSALVCFFALMHYNRELDILTFGDEQAKSVGVNAVSVKRRVLILASLMTGIAVCFTGTIGFVDLIVPHIVRRLYGPLHGRALPLSFFLGGAFLALADTLSRTVISPREIPVGAVTALIGAPFFIYLYFEKKV